MGGPAEGNVLPDLKVWGSSDWCGGPLGNAQIKGRRDGSGEAFYAKSLGGRM